MKGSFIKHVSRKSYLVLSSQLLGMRFPSRVAFQATHSSCRVASLGGFDDLAFDILLALRKQSHGRHTDNRFERSTWLEKGVFIIGDS